MTDNAVQRRENELTMITEINRLTESQSKGDSKGATGKIVSSIAVMMGGKGIILVIGFVTKIFLARILGPEHLGIYGLFIYICGLASTIANLGTQNAYIHDLGRGDTTVSKAVGFSISYALTAGLAAGVLLFALYRLWLHQLYFSNYITNAALIAACTVLFIPAQLLRLHLNAVFLGLKKFKAYNTVLIGSAVMLLSLFLFFTQVLDMKLSGALAAWLGSMLIPALLLLIYVWRKYQPLFRIKIADFRRIISFGFKAFLSGIIQTLIARVDLFFIGWFLDAEQLGLYFLASAIIENLDRLVIPIGQVFFTFASGMPLNQAAKLINTAFRFVLFGALIAFFLLIPLSYYGMPILFGPVFRNSSLALIILFPGVASRILMRILFAFFISRDKHVSAVPAYLWSLTALCVLDLLLIPAMGIMGAALGLTAANVVGLLVIAFRYKRLSGTPLSQLIAFSFGDIIRIKNLYREKKLKGKMEDESNQHKPGTNA